MFWSDGSWGKVRGEEYASRAGVKKKCCEGTTRTGDGNYPVTNGNT